MDTRTSYDRISPAYDLLADASESACRDHGLKALDLSRGERVLEVGFGTGHALTTMAGAVGPIGLVVGVDISSGMLAVTRRTLNNAGAVSVALALDDARSLCFRDAVFDAVFMSFTLELFELVDIAVVLREIDRVLRSTGRLVVVAMAQTPRSNAATNIYKWLHRHFPHFVDCRPIEVSGLLERAGFRTARAELMSIWGLSVASVLATKAGNEPGT